MASDSDPMDLDPVPPGDEFTAQERAELRAFLRERVELLRMVRDQERVRWLGRAARRWWPLLVGVATAAYGVATGWAHFIQWAARQVPPVK